MLVKELRGVGRKTDTLLQKLKIRTVEDLLMHYPRRYEEHPAPIPVSEIKTDQVCAIMCKVIAPAVKGKNDIVSVKVADLTGKTSCKWFHNPYINHMLKNNKSYVFYGKVCEYYGNKYLMQPSFWEAEEYWKIVGSLTPVYPLTKGLSNKQLFSFVLQSIQYIDETESLPDPVIKTYNLISKGDAIRCIHYPANEEVLCMARKRIVFEEFYSLLYSIRERTENRGGNTFRIENYDTVKKVVDLLPYQMTGSQKQAMEDIVKDFKGDTVSNRLVQGDVGSGKTLVALLSMIIMADNRHQSVLMAPTEVLASQHYKELIKLLKTVNMEEDFSPVLLTGSLKEKEKAEIRKKIASGESLIVIGTHAVIQEKVSFKNLALAVIDEQHRFGVEQRDALTQKGSDPVHAIFMTATPIPRTTGNIIFGGMDISIMRDKPKGRTPVKSLHICGAQFSDVYGLVTGELKKGHQAYVICPMVVGDDDGKKSVEEVAENMEKMFCDYKVGKVHGKLDPQDKNNVMEKFASGEIDILVATTVIEVGVNVPNATVIMIEGANNFGMLQLHQLRGRVGRGSDQSYCIFIDTSEKPSEKLDILTKTDDGFEIAEADYNLRKAGELLGTRQSGDMGFKLADIVRDEELLKQAAEALKKM